ncbi:RAD21 cohesin complex component verthandi [Arctopsyche grandis]|uniref:RAD21 cohesin complex component verthandi n=1 Tax=Arctopsyche grandis TaxID=121162 RepID=UPI00406D7D4B
MFYAHFVLAKKGPLAKIWLAAHWDKKLTKAHVFETNIEKSVDGILQPKVKMALRTSGHLLLGVVRIYSRKAKYLLADCNEAFVKIKMAFRPGMVDLPEEHREAAMNAITLPEVFHDFDTAMPELNDVDIEAQFSLNQSRAEEITMREDYGSLNLVTHDDGFGDIGFDTDGPDIMRDAMEPEASLEQSNLLFADGPSLDLVGKESLTVPGVGVGPSMVSAATPLPSSQHAPMDSGPPPLDDGFGGTIGDDFGHAGGLFEGDLFGDVSGAGVSSSAVAPGGGGLRRDLEEAAAAGVTPRRGGPSAPHDRRADSDDDDDGMDHYDGGMSPAHSWDGSHGSPQQSQSMSAEGPMGMGPDGIAPSPARPPLPDHLLLPPPSVPPPSVHSQELDERSYTPCLIERAPSRLGDLGRDGVPGDGVDAHEGDHTTLLQNEEESFALAPVDASVLKGITKAKRKRKLIVDEVKNISGEEMKNQLSNTSDIVTTLDLAPPTRRLMHWKETGGVEKLFALPARPIPSRSLFKNYQRNMSYRATDIEEVGGDGPSGEQMLAQQASPTPAPQARRSGRKRKHEDLASATPIHEPEMLQELEPPTPIPQEYQPSIDNSDIMAPSTPGYAHTPSHDMDPQTPGGILSSLGPLTPGVLGPLTPGTLLQGGITPGSLQHGGLTPGGLQHGGLTPSGLHDGGLTPAGLHHGGLTPGGLQHGGMTPVGLHHGGMTPAGLHHGGMTPAGLHHGGMTPAGLHHGGMTPAGLHHGGMTPAGLHHGGMTPAGLQHGDMMQHGGMTPVGLQHGGMTPAGLQHGSMLHMTPSALQHGMVDDMPMMPHLPVDQVSSLLGDGEVGGVGSMGVSGAPPTPARGDLEHTLPMEPLPLHGLGEQTHHYQSGIGSVCMANMGYDEAHQPHSPQDDYEFPPSVGHNGEEQLQDETDEQFEERVLNKRATQLFAQMRSKLVERGQLYLSEMTHRNKRKQVAQKFYSLLVLKKVQVLQISQDEPYADILITRGSLFDSGSL